MEISRVSSVISLKRIPLFSAHGCWGWTTSTRGSSISGSQQSTSVPTEAGWEIIPRKKFPPITSDMALRVYWMWLITVM